MSAPQLSAPPRRAAFGFIFASAVTTAMSFGLMIPVLPNLVREFVGGDTASAAEWVVLFTVVGGFMSFFAGPVLGLLSDRYGRRPVLLVSLLGLGVDFLLMAFAPTLLWLLVGRIVSGVTSGAFSTANAYVADIVTPENRARAFGFMGSAFSFGFLAGPAIGGLLGDYNLRWPFFAAAALTLANVLYGYFIVPESLPLEKRASGFNWRKANPLGALVLLRSHKDLAGLSVISFLNGLANMVWPSIFVLYTGHRYGWTPGQTGLVMMVGGLFGVASQTLLVGPAVRHFGERGAMIIGSTSSMLGMAWIAYAPLGWMYFIGMPLNSLSGLIIPGLQGLMTRHVAPHEQGQLQGANQSIQGIAGMVGPLIFGLTFAWSVGHPQIQFPGLAVAIAAVIMGICLVMSLRMGRGATPAAAAAAPGE